MRVLFFCENANQVHISQSIANAISFPSHLSAEVIALDWDMETVGWVTRAMDALEWQVPFTNLIDKAPGLVGALNRENKKGVLKDIAFEFFKDFVRDPNILVVQFNDASVRGSSVAAVCRNTGVRRLLVQDGFLNFKSKTSNLQNTDQNYDWGSTTPEFVAVWGDAMAEALTSRHGTNAKSIHVVGITKRNMDIPVKVRHAGKSEDIRVLWADQAILDQNKAPRDKWLDEFAQISEALSEFQTTLRLHPSTKDKTRTALEDATDGRFVADIPARPQLSADDLAHYDVVVTYYSTIFLDCLVNNIPCVIYRTRSLDIELPSLDHPLISYCVDVDNLGHMVKAAAAIDADEETPASIFNFVAPGDGTANIAELIGRITPAGPQEKNGESQSILTDMEIYTNIRRLQGEKILVIGGSFGDHIGVGKPIKVFMEYVRELHLDIDFHLATNGDRMNLLRKVSEASLVLINGFDVVKICTEIDMKELLKLCEVRRVPIVFYCHETQYVYRSLLETVGGRVQSFVHNVLPKCHVLAVSDQQADWLASLGARSIRTVYNSIGPAFTPVTRVLTDSAPIVLIVGTRQKRKGVDLFSQVADLSKRNGDNWRFVWLGAHTKGAVGCYLSDAVEWVGHVTSDEVRSWLAKSSLFFLSSVDDPMPLGVGEALMSGVPCVTFHTTGFSDFITLHRSGEVFTAYEPHHAYQKLRQVIDNPDYYLPSEKDVKKIIGVAAFGKRMLIALGEIMIASNSQYRYRDQVSSPVALRRLQPVPKERITKPKSKFMATLDWLESVLPVFITRPGEKFLRAVGVLKKKK